MMNVRNLIWKLEIVKMYLDPRTIIIKHSERFSVKDSVLNITIAMLVYIIFFKIYSILNLDIDISILVKFLLLFPFLFIYNNLVYFELSKLFKSDLNFLKQVFLSSLIEIPLSVLYSALFLFFKIITIPIALSIYRMYLQTMVLEVSHSIGFRKALIIAVTPSLLYIIPILI